jgi:outer membrane lipoprotein-sorting protein
MRKQIFIILLAMALVVGMSLLEQTLPVGSNAYAFFNKNKGFTNSFMMETCDGFASEGNNPYFVLEPGFKLILEGKEKKEDVKLVITVLDETKTIHYNPDKYDDIVEARVVEERETINEVLVEVSRNYFAICNRTNSVFYFGEEVDIYENGVVVSHEGAWEAGVDGARAGIIMPGVILLGGKYYQEIAPGVAMDRAEIISMTKVVQVPAGTFESCLETYETSPIDRNAKGYKFYAPGIGLAKDGVLELTNYSGMVP